jgi:hypothetical protein
LPQVWTAGQVVGLIHDVPKCAELISRIEREAIEAMKQSQNLLVGEDQQGVSSPGTVGKNTNNPGAEVWGVGKSKL